MHATIPADSLSSGGKNAVDRYIQGVQLSERHTNRQVEMRTELTGVLNVPSHIFTTLISVLQGRSKILRALVGIMSLGVGLSCGYVGVLYLTGSYVGTTVWMPVGFLLLSIECISLSTYCFTDFVG